MTVKVEFKFDGQNARAQRVAKRQGARMVTRVSRETKDAIRTMISRSIREGIHPYEAAKSIKSMVGLTTQQSQSAMNYRRSLVDMGHTPAKIDQLFMLYTDKKLRERSLSIARTETMEALNLGMLEGWEQAEKGGFLDEAATKEVIVTYDERTCPQCAPLDGQKRRLNQPFSNGMQAPPFHPLCRCTMGVNP